MNLRSRLSLYMRIGFLQGLLDEMGHDPNAQGYSFVVKDLSRCRQVLKEAGNEEASK